MSFKHNRLMAAVSVIAVSTASLVASAATYTLHPGTMMVSTIPSVSVMYRYDGALLNTSTTDIASLLGGAVRTNSHTNAMVKGYVTVLDQSSTSAVYCALGSSDGLGNIHTTGAATTAVFNDPTPISLLFGQVSAPGGWYVIVGCDVPKAPDAAHPSGVMKYELEML